MKITNVLFAALTALALTMTSSTMALAGPYYKIEIKCGTEETR